MNENPNPRAFHRFAKPALIRQRRLPTPKALSQYNPLLPDMLMLIGFHEGDKVLYRKHR